LSTLYVFAERKRLWRGDNPARGIEPYPEKSRDRFLQPDELPKLWKALSEASPDLQDFVNLSLWCATRRSDTLSAKWEDIALDDAIWRIPNPKARVPYIVPLMPEAVEILRARLARRKGDSPYVFPSRSGTGHMIDPKRGWQQLLKDAQLDYADEPHRRPRIHDLRRTLSSFMITQGTSLPIVAKALGHASSASVTEVYARIDLSAVKQAMQSAHAAMRATERQKKPRMLPAPAKQTRKRGRRG
jgi:integrase